MWPAVSMAREIHRRRTQNEVGSGDVAPTTVDRNDTLVAGGTPEGSAVAQRASWTAILAFLAEYLDVAEDAPA
jgi:hypothetical protein